MIFQTFQKYVLFQIAHFLVFTHGIQSSLEPVSKTIFKDFTNHYEIKNDVGKVSPRCFSNEDVLEVIGFDDCVFFVYNISMG